jgi:hypothetical protein
MMNTEERKYRFSEIMSSVSLLPDVDMESKDDEDTEMAQEWVLPNLTKHVGDKKIGDAILCQALREGSEFKFKLIALLCNSATRRINECEQNDTIPTDDDMNALAISANVLWSAGQTTALFGLLGMIGTVCNRFELDLPILSTAFIVDSDGIDKFGKLDPIALLEGKVSKKDVIDVTSQDDSE